MVVFDKIEWKALGEMIRSARLDAGLTLEELAGRACISLTTLKNAEYGWRAVSDKTLASLQRVLGPFLITKQQFGEEAAALAQAAGSYDAAQVQRKLRQACRREGSKIPYEYLCASANTTEKYISIFEGGYFNRNIRQLMDDMTDLALRINQIVGYAPVDVIAFTCAHSWLDIELVNQIALQRGDRIKFYLIHPSNFLLGRMVSEIASKAELSMIETHTLAIQQEFFHAPSGMPFLRRRLYCIFGLLYNINNIRHSLDTYTKLAESGDLLLFDISDFDRFLRGRDPHRYDIRLNGALPLDKAMEALFWEVLNENTERRVVHVDYTTRSLQNNNDLNSYTIDFDATVEFSDGTTQRMSAVQIHRTPAARVTSYLESRGWALVWRRELAMEEPQPNPTTLLLFIKK